MTATFVGMPPFPTAARDALGDTQLRHNLAHATGTIRAKRARVVAEVENWEDLRLAGAAVKERALRDLDQHLVTLEASLTAQGAVVCGFEAVPGPAPEHIEQTAPLSLVSYLPDNIEDLEYIPHGMQGCVENMRGRRANRRAKGLPEWKRPII